MKFHVVGRYPSTREHVSLAVVQFVELVRGERPVQEPQNLFRVAEVVAEERYCLHCLDVHWHDVVYPRHPLWKTIRRCRNCGKEGSG